MYGIYMKFAWNPYGNMWNPHMEFMWNSWNRTIPYGFHLECGGTVKYWAKCSQKWAN